MSGLHLILQSGDRFTIGDDIEVVATKVQRRHRDGRSRGTQYFLTIKAPGELEVKLNGEKPKMRSRTHDLPP